MKKYRYKKYKGFSELNKDNIYKEVYIKDLLDIKIPLGRKKHIYKNIVGVYKSGNILCHSISYNSEYLGSDLLLMLSEYSKEIMILPNAGGNSLISEILSLEIMINIFKNCFPRKRNNKLLSIITEGEVKYTFPNNSPKTDYIIKLMNKSIAVSVTRAMHFGEFIFTEDKARKIISGKVRRIHESNKNVLPPYNWNNQILHVITQREEYAKILKKVFNELDSEYTDKIFIICSVIESPLPFIRDEHISAGLIEETNNAILQINKNYL